MTTPHRAHRLPGLLQRPVEAWLQSLLLADAAAADGFAGPFGEPALVASNSVSWRVFKNPLTVFVGGVAAVLLELAEPRVRSGVWQYTTFRTAPLQRLQRTGHAAMMTVYGPRSGAETMIAQVRQLHAAVHGVTPTGQPYRANDPELLTWVHATACFGFLQAYHLWATPLDAAARDAFYLESAPVARLYGADAPPLSGAALDDLFERTSPQLEASEIILEFLRILRRMPLLPLPMRPLQTLLLKAAVQTLPRSLRERIGLEHELELTLWQRRSVRALARAADRLLIRTHPAVLACRRLGLPEDQLFN